MNNHSAPALLSLTGELYQPVRLYYRIPDMRAFLCALRKMRCMQADVEGKRWVWLYEAEAKTLTFKRSYKAIPKPSRPIILGSWYTDDEHHVHLDLGSIERAVEAIVFFDKYLTRRLAEVKFAAIFNRLLTQAEHPGPNLDALFSGVKIEDIAARQAAELAAVTSAIQSGRLRDFLREPRFELVESFPVNFYVDGIDAFDTSLQMRQVVAFKRWQGDKDFTLTDLLAANAFRLTSA